jgi:hypothetical protein
MEILALLEQARRAGLELRVDGDAVIVRGPREQEGLVKALAEHKAELLRLLRQARATEPAQTTSHQPVPDRPCPTCGGRRWWPRPTDGAWLCSRCRPCPIPDEVQEIISPLRDMREAMQGAALELAEALAWPRIELDSARSIPGGRSCWHTFARAADLPTLRRAIDRLKALLAEMARDDEEEADRG